MAKRFYNTLRIEEDWYMNLSLKHRELLRYCESKCDQAGVMCFNAVIASTYIGAKISESDLQKIGAVKLQNGKFFLPWFINEQNSEIKDTCPAHKPIYKSLKENEIDLSKYSTNRVFNTLQEKEIRIDKDKVIEKGIETDSAKSEKSLFVSLKNCFLDWYLAEKGSAYYFTGKDGAAIKSLIKKIEFAWAQKNDGKPPDDWVVSSMQVLLKNLPDWVHKNGSLSVIDSQFNTIKDGNKSPKSTTDAANRKFDEELARVRSYGNPYARKENNAPGNSTQ